MKLETGFEYRAEILEPVEMFIIIRFQHVEVLANLALFVFTYEGKEFSIDEKRLLSLKLTPYKRVRG